MSKNGVMGEVLDELILECETPAEVILKWNAHFRENYTEDIIRVVDVYVNDEYGFAGAILNDSVAGPYTWCAIIKYDESGKLTWNRMYNMDIEPDNFKAAVESGHTDLAK